MESLSPARRTQRSFEECYQLKRTLLLTMLAVIPAVVLSVSASGQVDPVRKKPSADAADVDYKWEVFGGLAYTSLNNVTRSRYGLVGLKAGATRDFGRYFGLTAEGSYYKYALFSSATNKNLSAIPAFPPPWLGRSSTPTSTASSVASSTDS